MAFPPSLYNARHRWPESRKFLTSLDFIPEILLRGVAKVFLAAQVFDAADRKNAAAAIKRALESAGVEFIAENGGGAGVGLRK